MKVEDAAVIVVPSGRSHEPDLRGAESPYSGVVDLIATTGRGRREPRLSLTRVRPEHFLLFLYATHSGLKSRASAADPGLGNPGLKYGIPSGFTSLLCAQAPSHQQLTPNARITLSEQVLILQPLRNWDLNPISTHPFQFTRTERSRAWRCGWRSSTEWARQPDGSDHSVRPSPPAACRSW